MKFFIFLFCCLVVVEARSCKFSLLGSAVTDKNCTTGTDYCVEYYFTLKGVVATIQGCSGEDYPDNKDIPQKCTAVGTNDLKGTDLTGQYDCCNTDGCNTKQLNANPGNSAIRPFALGAILLSTILSLLY